MKDLLKVEISKNRIYGLDILRALAILFVVYGHGTHITADIIPIEYSFIPVFDGVSMFFVLSGFLIGGILMKTISKDGSSLKNLFTFWSRRWYRTLPNYFLVLSIIVVCYYFLGALKEDSGTISRYYTFLQNFNAPQPKFFGEAWSLAVEEWFYLMVPVAAFALTGLLRLDLKKAIPLIAIGFIIGVTLVRFYKFSTLGLIDMDHWDAMYRKQVMTRLDSIMFGVLGAYAFLYMKDHWFKWRKAMFFAGIAGMLLHRISFLSIDWAGQGTAMQLYYSVFSFTFVSISTLLLIPYLNNLKAGKGFIYKSLTYISLISYSMYLINATLVKGIALPVITLHLLPVIENPVAKVLVSYFLFWSITIVGSILLYKYFEMPFLKLRDMPLRAQLGMRLKAIPLYAKRRSKPALPVKAVKQVPTELPATPPATSKMTSKNKSSSIR